MAGLCCAALALPSTALIRTIRSHHTLLVLSYYFGGKAGTCSLAESFSGEALSRLQAGNAAELRSSSRLARKDDQFTLWETPLGSYWMPNGGDSLFYDLGEQRRNLYGTGIRVGDIVLDAGANVGVFTRKALWAGAGKVVAIEPAPENLECLRRTFAAEVSQGRVVIYPKGIWDRDEVLKMSVDPGDSARDTFVRPIENARSVALPLTTVDRMVEELRLARVDFIKMDIEGAEQRAIAGAKSTIARFRPRMALSIYHLKDDPVKIPELVRSIVPDYRMSKTCLCSPDRVQPEVAFFN
jgi:FkbM family methyltransferase